VSGSAESIASDNPALSSASPAGPDAGWRFPFYTGEAKAIGNSRRQLIAAGLPAPQIMILLSNKRFFDRIKRELNERDVPNTPIKDEMWADTDGGRFILGFSAR